MTVNVIIINDVTIADHLEHAGTAMIVPLESMAEGAGIYVKQVIGAHRGRQIRDALDRVIQEGGEILDKQIHSVPVLA